MTILQWDLVCDVSKRRQLTLNEMLYPTGILVGALTFGVLSDM